MLKWGGERVGSEPSRGPGKRCRKHERFCRASHRDTSDDLWRHCTVPCGGCGPCVRFVPAAIRKCRLRRGQNEPMRMDEGWLDVLSAVGVLHCPIGAYLTRRIAACGWDIGLLRVYGCLRKALFARRRACLSRNVFRGMEAQVR